MERQEARKLCLTRYSTGRPCRYGHISYRLASNGSCLECCKLRTSDASQRNLPSAVAKRERTSSWKSRNAEYVREYQKQWYASNRVAIARYAKEYHAVNAAKILDSRRQALLRNGIWASAINLRGGIVTRARRKKLRLDEELTILAYLANWLLRQPTCECCGVLFDLTTLKGAWNDRSPTVDRFTPSRGHTVDNCSLLCWRCNTMKRDYTVSDLGTLIKWMVGRVG